MQVSVIQQIIDLCINAFEQLGASVPLFEIEQLATTVHRTMTASARSYHTSDHVLHLAESSDPIQSLAAIFHDIVYHQVDKGFSTDVYPVIAPYIQENGDDVWIREDIDENERVLMILLDVFGLNAGQKLSISGGQNEFLSALFANKTLEKIFSEEILLKIMVCIEATIPFRGNNEQGESCFIQLKKRLLSVNNRWQLSLAPATIEELVRSAVVFANRDVDSFCERDSGKFLAGTWKLLPEINSSLRSQQIYSIRDYRQALEKMEDFFLHLRPEVIFHEYDGTPLQTEFQRMTYLARRNITIAREYLGIKLLAIAIIEALAEATGGNAPLPLFMGDLKQEEGSMKRLADFLPPDGTDDSLSPDSLLASLLEKGRANESSFDIKNSPTSFFLYKRLEPARIHTLLKQAHEMFDEKKSAHEFLSALEKPVLASIANACAEMVMTRREALLQYTRS